MIWSDHTKTAHLWDVFLDKCEIFYKLYTLKFINICKKRMMMNLVDQTDSTIRLSEMFPLIHTRSLSKMFSLIHTEGRHLCLPSVPSEASSMSSVISWIDGSIWQWQDLRFSTPRPDYLSQSFGSEVLNLNSYLLNIIFVCAGYRHIIWWLSM